MRSLAAAVAALLMLSLSTVELPHVLGAHHDADCDIIVVVVHDASAHHVAAGGPLQSTRPEHCLACHWGRSFRTGDDDLQALSSPVAHTVAVRVPEQPFVPGRAPVAQPPLRSPPAA